MLYLSALSRYKIDSFPLCVKMQLFLLDCNRILVSNIWANILTIFPKSLAYVSSGEMEDEFWCNVCLALACHSARKEHSKAYDKSHARRRTSYYLLCKQPLHFIHGKSYFSKAWSCVAAFCTWLGAGDASPPILAYWVWLLRSPIDFLPSFCHHFLPKVNGL